MNKNPRFKDKNGVTSVSDILWKQHLKVVNSFQYFVKKVSDRIFLILLRDKYLRDIFKNFWELFKAIKCTYNDRIWVINVSFVRRLIMIAWKTKKFHNCVDQMKIKTSHWKKKVRDYW